ncbi:hypothetical protein MLD38_005135 [Melastoma candidum]|uniref:Uncharacterized protein n=1 Tax=Melastoma candidum TaxID=119954 RepID=A0ACB9SGI3_9MYRT|nr:hypothetical protein MLD38_005135 [Melastoma candidum]
MGTSPAALLYDALDNFDRRSAKADENFRLIHASLPEAVEACVDAAGHEFDHFSPRTLLRAASYGQAFCSAIQLALTVNFNGIVYKKCVKPCGS